MKLILLGAPGSGKGTQATYISDKYDLPHISTGDIFRENIKNKTSIGLKIIAVMDTGNLCPDDLTVELVKDRLNNSDCEKGFILDGFPRNLFQAKALEEFCSPDVVLNIDVDLHAIEHRITGRRTCSECGDSYHVDNIGHIEICPHCGGKLITRKDDNADTVKSRLNVYQTQTMPLIEFYKAQGKLVNIDGNKSVEQVFADIQKVLG